MTERARPAPSAMITARQGRDEARRPAPPGTRYFFHVRNGSLYPDEQGRTCANRQDAIAQASILAAELGRDGDWAGFEVTVTDEAGEIVVRKPIQS
jgi:hypothetical protein